MAAAMKTTPAIPASHPAINHACVVCAHRRTARALACFSMRKGILIHNLRHALWHILRIPLCGANTRINLRTGAERIVARRVRGSPPQPSEGLVARLTYYVIHQRPNLSSPGACPARHEVHIHSVSSTWRVSRSGHAS